MIFKFQILSVIFSSIKRKNDYAYDYIYEEREKKGNKNNISKK